MSTVLQSLMAPYVGIMQLPAMLLNVYLAEHQSADSGFKQVKVEDMKNALITNGATPAGIAEVMTVLGLADDGVVYLPTEVPAYLSMGTDLAKMPTGEILPAVTVKGA